MTFPNPVEFPNTWITPLSSVLSQERMDAEHFNPFYAAIEAAITMSDRSEVLGDLLSYCKRAPQPKYDPTGEILVLNSQQVGEHFCNLDGAERTSQEYWDKKPAARVKKYDVLVNSTGIGTIGRVNCVLHDEPTVVDNHVSILRVKPGSVDPLYLAVFLNSRLGREQTYRWQSGSSGQIELYPDDIKRFVVVVPDPDVQAGIASDLQAAYDALRVASGLAQAAETSVEDLI
jgi:type I restriction enzyme M protein